MRSVFQGGCGSQALVGPAQPLVCSRKTLSPQGKNHRRRVNESVAVELVPQRLGGVGRWEGDDVRVHVMCTCVW